MADDQELVTVLNTVTFLRMAKAEMRRVATEHPDIAVRLEVIIEKCEDEIGELTKQFGLPPSDPLRSN